MAKQRKGRRTAQYNPGTKTLGAYAQAVATHTRGAHDESGKIIHDTPKSKRREFAGEIWDRRKARGNPRERKIPKNENIFGFSKKERTAKRKRRSAGATEARGAGYRLGLQKSDEHFQEWLDRKDFGDEKEAVKIRLGKAFSEGFERGKKEFERKEDRIQMSREKKRKAHERAQEVRRIAERKRADEVDRKLEREMREKGYRNPRIPRWGYGVYTAGVFGEDQIAHFKSKKAAQAYVRLNDIKGAKVKLAFEKNPAPRPATTKNGVRKSRRHNPESAAAELSEKFHGRPANELTRVIEFEHDDSEKTKLGDLVRLVIDTPTGKVVYLNFNLSKPSEIVNLSTRPVKGKNGEVIGKQLYFVGGDQEVNLKALGMAGPEWTRDRMELGRLHHFPKSANEGAIVYRTKKTMHNLKLTDYWHRPGEETIKAVGPAALPLVIYDLRNKHLELAGGQYYIDAPGIIN